MKPVIILTKGPSARFLESSDKYDVATVNNAIWMHSAPRWAFFNDIEPMEQMEDHEFKDVKHIVIPSFLHSNHNPRTRAFSGAKIINQHHVHIHWTKLGELFPNRFDHVGFYTYELHPGDNMEANEQALPLDEWPMTTTQTATMWLLKHAGVRDIIMAGADPGKGYHQLYIDRAKYNEDGTPAFGGNSTAAQPTYVYQQCYNQSVKWANHYGARLRHINELSEEELKQLEIVGS